MDDIRLPGDIIGEIVGVAGDVAKTVGGEMQKIGKSATSQIGGSDQSGQSSNITASNVTDASSLKPSGGKKDFSLFSELKAVGKTMGSQIAGGTQPDASTNVNELKKKDEEFSKSEVESIRVKVDQIYKEYAQKKVAEEQKKKEEAMKQHEEKRQKREEIQQLKKLDAPNPAIAKTRAEIKNYGAE